MAEVSAVDEIVVARYYLKCEIGRAIQIWRQTEDFVKAFDQAIGNLNAEEACRLAHVLSGPHYRNNPLYQKWGLLRWRLQKISCHQIRVSRINPKVNPTLERFGCDLVGFVQHLRNGGLQDENLKEFRDEGRRIWHTNIIGEHSGDRVQILDGSHRAVILALRGDSEISCYVGIDSTHLKSPSPQT